MDALRFLVQGRTQQPGLEEFLAPMQRWGQPVPAEQMRAMGAGLPTPLLDLNSKLNFEQRMLRPSQYPVLDNKDGSVSTHRMGWNELPGGGFAVYPTIVQNKGGALQQLDDREAWDYALRTGEFRKFMNQQEAAAYAEGGYKKSWGLGEQR